MSQMIRERKLIPLMKLYIWLYLNEHRKMQPGGERLVECMQWFIEEVNLGEPPIIYPSPQCLIPNALNRIAAS
jgi:hypothetical protein